MHRHPVREFVAMSLAAGAGIVGWEAYGAAHHDQQINRALLSHGGLTAPADGTSQAEYQTMSDQSDRLLFEASGLGLLACAMVVGSVKLEITGHGSRLSSRPQSPAVPRIAYRPEIVIPPRPAPRLKPLTDHITSLQPVYENAAASRRRQPESLPILSINRSSMQPSN